MNDIPIIRSFNQSSEAGLDVFAPAIFLGGCNLKCPYCMNSKLALGTSTKQVKLDDVKRYVLEEKSDWIMISGGEPTCSDLDMLLNLIKEIKTWGCKIGVSTNGSKPEILKEILPFIQYVAMDLKSPEDIVLKELGFEHGKTDVTNTHSILTDIKTSRNDFNYEIRTTLYPLYVNKNTIVKMSDMLNKDDLWVLQQFRHAKNMLDPKCSDTKPYDLDEINILIDIAKKYINNIQVRYV